MTARNKVNVDEEDDLWFVCKFCGRSSINEDDIESHEWLMHLQCIGYSCWFNLSIHSLYDRYHNNI